MSQSPYEYPDGLEAKGRRLWDLYAAHFGEKLPELDTVMLEQACNAADLLSSMHDFIVENPKDNAAVTRYAIMTDKFVLFSRALGLTLADRVATKIELSPKEIQRLEAEKEREAKKNPNETRGRKKRSSLDDLTPDKLGIGV